MILEEVKKAVDHFSLNELRQLREYIQGREQQIDLRAGTVDMDALLSALEEIRAGMTEEEFAEIERAMNEEYIEPLDSDE
jgi:hypothetical protein